MIVFLDTNIFYNNWYLKNANFTYLFNFLENNKSKLLISEIVTDEIDNNFQKTFIKAKSEFVKKTSDFEKLLDKKIDVKIEEINYSFKKVMDDKTYHYDIFKYDNILNSNIIKRLIKNKKPFLDDEKGYKDTLIWLSFLDYLKDNNITEKIAFINNNSSDFYNKEKTNLHEDLLDDIKEYELTNEFKIYLSINDFIKEVNLNDEHFYSKSQIIELIDMDFEREIQNKIVDYLKVDMHIPMLISPNNYPITNFGDLFTLEIIEGIEDLEVLDWNKLDEDNIFIDLKLNLRRTTLEFTIINSIYEKFVFLNQTNEYECDIFQNYVILRRAFRIDFKITFEYNLQSKAINGLSIYNIYLR